MARSFTLSVANVREKPQNTLYPNVKEISSIEELREILKFDHVAGTFKGNHRKNENFIKANCLMMDCDNTETDDESKWITPESIRAQFPDIEFYTCYSRNHMKEKNGKTPRPKFHIYFILHDEITEARKIRALKEQLLKIIPDADNGAKDAARYFNGVANPEILYFNGVRDIISFIGDIPNNEPDLFTSKKDTAIYEGSRNKELFNAGIHYILTCKNEEQAKKYFWRKSKKCVPMLDISELAHIWQSVLNSDAYKYKKLAQELGNEELFILKAKEQQADEKIIKMVCSAVFSDKTIAETLNSLAIKFLLEYKQEATARKHFLIEANKYIDSFGIDSIMAFFENAKDYDLVQLAFLARELKDNPEEYQKKATEISDDSERINSVWSKENGGQEGQRESRVSFSELFGKKEKYPIDINVVAKALNSLGIKLRLNVITQKIEVDNIPHDNPYVLDKFHELPEFEKNSVAVDLLIGILTPYLSSQNFAVNLALLKSYIGSIAAINRYNPIEDMLKSQQWDGQDRITEIYKIMGISENTMYCRLVKKWLIQSVAMGLNDNGIFNCEFALILKGEQGIGKTNFFNYIGMRPEWVNLGADIDLRDKDSKIKAISTWIIEIGEINATFKREQSQLKSFITDYFTDLRLPYAEREKKYPRHCTFCGTVNNNQFLKDVEGGTRRWVIIKVNHIDGEKMRSLPKDWYIQLWIQAYNLFLQNNNEYRLDSNERAFIEQENRTASEYLPGELEILDFLDWEADISEWRFMNASQFLFLTKQSRITAPQIGKAINKIMQYDKRIKFKAHGKQYLLPPLKNMSMTYKDVETIPEKQPEPEQKISLVESILTAEDFAKLDLLSKEYQEIINLYYQMPESEREKINFELFFSCNQSIAANNQLKFDNAIRWHKKNKKE